MRDSDAETRALISRRSQTLGPAYRLFYDRPVQFVRGEGVHLYDTDGKSYLDAYNNVPSVGHSHPAVVAAISQQAATLNTHTRYPAAPILDYAERLLATHSIGLENMMFTCTGSEAIDLALRIVKFNTGKAGIVVTANAYHGVTAACAGISPSLGTNSPLDPGVRVVSFPDPPIGDSRQETETFVASVSEAISDLERSGHGFAGFVADSVFSSDGLRPDPVGLLSAVSKLVRASGGLYVADEVQAGFGRTGDSMWGYERHGFEPDVAVMGKPMGNGMPIAGIAVRADLLRKFGPDIRYFNTFGGNSVCVAAASAVLDVLEDEDLKDNSRMVGRYLRDGLREQSKGFPFLGDVRGVGLFVAVDVVDPIDGRTADPARASRIVNGLMSRRILIGASGLAANTLKIRPPLPFSRENADQFINEFTDLCQALS
ncbi:MAG: aspartate aminotransferase family protein [Thermoleophilia bacterium]|nr:aspartate aminotransferase family protein [Thermoleophilia bacterium]